MRVILNHFETIKGSEVSVYCVNVQNQVFREWNILSDQC